MLRSVSFDAHDLGGANRRKASCVYYFYVARGYACARLQGTLPEWGRRQTSFARYLTHFELTALTKAPVFSNM